jgi:very-short-patch-repair endonuclease
MDKRDFARQLRHRSTDAERLLWRHLRSRRFAGFKFRRQEPVGAYIPDFVCHEGRLILELDGGQHAGQRAYDERRDVWLASQEFRVLRFPDNYVLTNLQGAMERIWQTLAEGGDGKEK